MIAKHLERINSLLNKAKTEAEAESDSIALISTHMTRAKTAGTGSFRTRSTTVSTCKKVAHRREEITVEL